MLSQFFPDLLLTLFVSAICTNMWYLYYLHINAITTPSVQVADVKKPKLIELSSSIRIIIIGAIILSAFLMNYIFVHYINTFIVLWDSIHISHNTINYLYIILLLLFTILLCGCGLFNQNISFSSEYLLFVVLIVLVSYLLMSSTNLFLTIFLLEFIALLIFGKLAVSRILYKQNKMEKKNPSATPQFSYGLFNSLFFQFWANFVSSICLFFSLLNIHYMFGTSNFFIINFLLSILASNIYFINIFSSITLIVLTTGLFVKLGLSPYQFFKIETYKGIPLFIIIVYTSLYLITYIYFFLFLFVYQLPSLRDFVGVYINFTLVLSLLYLVSLLFDTKNFKAFLSYSTLITISNLFLIILIS